MALLSFQSSWHSHGWPRSHCIAKDDLTSDPPPFDSWLPPWSNLHCARDRTQGSIHARQALYQQGFTPNPEFPSSESWVYWSPISGTMNKPQRSDIKERKQIIGTGSDSLHITVTLHQHTRAWEWGPVSWDSGSLRGGPEEHVRWPGEGYPQSSFG